MVASSAGTPASIIRFFNMAESIVDASGTIQAPNVIGIEIITMRFARERPETDISLGDGGCGLTNLL